jgi:hypothetical protein
MKSVNKKSDCYTNFYTRLQNRLTALIALLAISALAPQNAWCISVRFNQQLCKLPPQVLRARLLQQKQGLGATAGMMKSYSRPYSQATTQTRALKTPKSAVSGYRSPLAGSILTRPALTKPTGQPSRSFFSFFQKKIEEKVKDIMHPMLMEAINNNNIAEAERLIKAGADINAMDQTTGHVALVEIAKSPIAFPNVGGREKSAIAWTQLFLELGADPNIADNTGTTPLMAVVSSAGHRSSFVVSEAVEVAELLIDAGADINYTNQGISIFDAAVASGNIDVVRLLLDNHNLKVDFAGKQGENLLFSAIKRNNTEMAQLLLAKGAPVNGTEDNRVSPLHIAAIRGNKTMLQLLLENGANPESRDIYGYTPATYALLGRTHVDEAKWGTWQHDVIYKWRKYDQPLSYDEFKIIQDLLKNIRPEPQEKKQKQQRTPQAKNEADQIALKYINNINKPNEEKEKGSSYQELALEYHPDVTKNDPKKQAIMIRINGLKDIQKQFAQDLNEYQDKEMSVSTLKAKYNPARVKNDMVLKELYKQLSKQIPKS